MKYIWSKQTTKPADQAGWTVFTNGSVIKRDSGDGEWYLHILAEDNGGNIAHAYSAVFYLDNSAPQIDITMTEVTEGDNGAPYSEGAWTKEKVHISIQATDAHHDELQIMMNGQLVETTKVDSYSFSWSQSGTHELAVIAKDKAGNQSEAKRTIKISTNRLTLATMLKQADNSVYTSGEWTNQAVTVSVQAHNADGALVTSSYSLDEKVTWQAYTQPLIFADEGNYTVWFKAQDEAGNQMVEVESRSGTSPLTEIRRQCQEPITHAPLRTKGLSNWIFMLGIWQVTQHRNNEQSRLIEAV